MLLALILSTFVVFCKGVAPPLLVTFGKFTYGGDGCPQGSVSNNFSPDRTSFTLLFDKYTASIGYRAPAFDDRKSCSLNMVVNVPSGYQYSLTTIDYRGYAKLDAGYVATHTTSYSFQGKAFTTRDSTVLRGPYARTYNFRERISHETWNYSPCNVDANLNIEMDIKLSKSGSASDTSSGYMTKTAIDGKNKVYQRWELVYRKC